MVEAGGTPKVKPPTAALTGAEGVAGRTSGPTSPTAGSYLEAPSRAEASTCWFVSPFGRRRAAASPWLVFGESAKR